MNYEVISYIIAIMYIVFMISLFCAAVYLFILIVKALKKYINSKDVREEKKVNAKSLGESLKENRLRCKIGCIGITCSILPFRNSLSTYT